MSPVQKITCQRKKNPSKIRFNIFPLVFQVHKDIIRTWVICGNLIYKINCLDSSNNLLCGGVSSTEMQMQKRQYEGISKLFS